MKTNLNIQKDQKDLGLKIVPLPHKTVPDWIEVARIIKENGPFLLPNDINLGAAKLALHRNGCAVYPVKIASEIVAYSAERIRNPRS